MTSLADAMRPAALPGTEDNVLLVHPDTMTDAEAYAAQHAHLAQVVDENREALEMYVAEGQDRTMVLDTQENARKRRDRELDAAEGVRRMRHGRMYVEHTAESQLEHLGVPRRARERWMRELTACTTKQQVLLTFECHQIEGYLIGRYGYGRV